MVWVPLANSKSSTYTKVSTVSESLPLQMKWRASNCKMSPKTSYQWGELSNPYTVGIWRKTWILRGVTWFTWKCAPCKINFASQHLQVRAVSFERGTLEIIKYGGTCTIGKIPLNWWTWTFLAVKYIHYMFFFTSPIVSLHFLSDRYDAWNAQSINFQCATSNTKSATWVPNGKISKKSRSSNMEETSAIAYPHERGHSRFVPHRFRKVSATDGTKKDLNMSVSEK